MNTVQLGERIAELAARINIATHEMLTLVAEFDRREGWADAFDSCAEWLAWRTGRTVATCRENVRVAHALEDLPATSAGMKAGRLSYAKARAITRVATPATEAGLLAYADKGSAAAVERMVREVRHLSRDGEIGAEEARHRARALSVFIDADGTYVVRGRLEPEAGAVLMRAVEAASDALGDRGRGTGGGRGGSGSMSWRRQRRGRAGGGSMSRRRTRGMTGPRVSAANPGTRACRNGTGRGRQGIRLNIRVSPPEPQEHRTVTSTTPLLRHSPNPQSQGRMAHANRNPNVTSGCVCFDPGRIP
ncbi:MAG: DUF222 domain-containing protein [Gemmatimonadota bacterium]|nr:DUF222 domain-containing protein [Gemmatimonadota bacterium]